MHIGIIAGSYKPYHAGHDMLIRLAAEENDIVHVFVSTSDRKRPGEISVSGSTMEEIWRRWIEPSLPSNVKVTYGGVPIRNVYELLGEANESGSDDVFFIYTDPEDAKRNFPDRSLAKYAENIFQNGQIVVMPTDRTSTVNVSGTKMRKAIESGDEAYFISHLPKAIRAHGNEIWSLLTNLP